MPDDFLNIWVVVHDKASASFEELSKHIKNADSYVNRLENSIGKLANSQSGLSKEQSNLNKINIKSLQDQLNLGKQYDELTRKTDTYKKKVNELATTHKDANKSMLDSIKRTSKEWETAAKQRLADSEKSDKGMLASIRRTSNEWEKTRKENEAKELAHQKVLGRHWDLYYKEEAKRSEDANKQKISAQKNLDKLRLAAQKNLDKEIEKLEKRAAAREFTHQKALGAWMNKGYEKIVPKDDRNRQTSLFGSALDKLTNQFNKSSQGSNTFYVRILGLRLPFLALGTALPPLIAGLVQLGGLLTALGSAAALAGAAIGGALVASMAQAAPVIGLLVVAFKQLVDIIKLSGEQQKQNIANQRQAADRSLALKRHLEQERQAHIDLANAQRGLTIARREALRNIQDLNKAEQDAYRSSQRATLGLIGSQAALAGLVSGGGSALDIANAQLDVRDATSNVGASRLTANRAAADAARARKQGVGGNPQVVAAQQAIISQQHQMILSQQEFANSLKHTNLALDDYHRRLKNLDPAQRKLFDSVVALRQEFKKEWKGITDPITNAFTGIVKGITKGLKDPDIKNAFKGLSGATGSAITQSTSFFGTPEAKRLFIQVIDDAKKNLPLIANILRDISAMFLRIAVAAGPFVHIILKNISDFFDRMEVKTRNGKQLSDFFTQAFAAAKAFWDVLTGVFDIFMALGTEGGVKTGVGLVSQLANYLHNIAEELRGNKAGVNSFFDRVRVTVGDLGTALDHILRGLVRIEKTNAFDTIIKVIDQILIPIVINLLVIFGEVLDSLGRFALAHPDIAKTSLVILGIGLAALKILPFLKTVRDAILAVRAAYILMATQATLSEAVIAASALPFLPFLGTILLVVAAVAAVAAAIYLLDKRFHFIHPTVVWLGKFIRNFGQAFIDAGHDIGHAAGVVVDNVMSIFRVTRDFLWKAINYFLLPYKMAIQNIYSIFKKVGDYILNSSFGDLLKSVWSGIAPVIEPIVSLVKDVYGWLMNIESVAKRLLHLGQGNSAQKLFQTLAKDHPEAFKSQYGEKAYQEAIKGQYTGNEALPSSAGGPPGTSGPIGTPTKGGVRSPVLETALQSVNVPYKWGGSDLASGVDCSGLVWAAAKKQGIDIPRRSQEQAKLGVEVGFNDMLPGDLLFYDTPRGKNSHEAIYAGNGNMLEAQKSGTSVHVVPLRTSGLSAIRRVRGFQTGLNQAPKLPSTSTSARQAQTVPTGGNLNTDPTRTAGIGSAVPDIIRAAQATGIDPAVFLATALTESGARYGAVGDKGTSFGPFQHHKGGALGSHDPAWANSYAGILERAQQFKRLQIATGKGAAALQRPADPAAYAAKVDANLARARQLIAEVDPTQSTSSRTTTKARGPGVRGGAATEVILGAKNLLVDIANGIKVNVWNALDQIALGFKRALGANSVGYKLMITSITALDQLFTNQARNLSRLVSAQRTRMIQSRYRVSGASGATSVVDQGSDAADARQNLANLGIDRDSILGQLQNTTSALQQFQRELSRTPNNKKNQAKRQLLITTIKRYQDQQQTLQESLNQNTVDLVNAQTAVIQNQVDAAQRVASRTTNLYGIRIAVAKLTGIDKGSIPWMMAEQVQALVNERGPLQAALDQAQAQGNQLLAENIYDALKSLDQQIAEGVQARFDYIVSQVDEQTNRAMSKNDLQSRMANLGGNAFNTLGRQSGVLQARQGIIQQSIASNQWLLGQASNSVQQQEIQDRIDELNTQLAENTDAIKQNSEDIAQSRVDRINSLGAFRGGINSGAGGLLQSLANLTGALDVPSLIKSLTNQQNNLKTTGSGLRGELQSQFGINLSSDPKTLIQQLTNTDFGALEFGMDDKTKSTFEGLINSIIDNATALVDNTVELKKANDTQTMQDWSSSLWTNFRDALFTGNGGILGGIPQAATGAHILSAGLMKVHAGETIVPASTSKYQADTTHIEVNVDNRGEGNVDTLALTKRLAFEMNTRGR